MSFFTSRPKIEESKQLNKMSTTTIKTQVQVQMKTFDQHIVSTVADTIWTGYAVDCCIRSKDKSFSCHRIILSMASPFFVKIFESTTQGRLPEIIIPEVSSQVLQMIINIIYTGETWVPANFRQEFSDVCRLLEIKGYEDFYEDTSGDPFVSTVDSIVTEEEQIDDSSHFDNDNEIEFEESMEQDHETEVLVTPTIDYQRRMQQRPSMPVTKRGDNMDGILQIPGVNIVHSRFATFGKIPRISLEETEATQVYMRLINIYRKTYRNTLQKIDDIEERDFKVELAMNGNLLVYGRIQCVLCKLKIDVPYLQAPGGRFRQWSTTAMLTHLKRAHTKFL